jgi:hypothetical protein
MAMNKEVSVLDAFTPEDIDCSEVEDIVLNEFDIEKAHELDAKKKLKYKQQKQMHDMVDTRYYAVVVFGNKADKEKWFETLDGIDISGDRTYIDGYQLAKKYGNEIEMTATLPEPHYVKQLKLKKK